eukprot:4154215-Pleurochrysis_carterae.AAC.1
MSHLFDFREPRANELDAHWARYTCRAVPQATRCERWHTSRTHPSIPPTTVARLIVCRRYVRPHLNQHL